MKSSYKLALLAVLGLAGVAQVQAYPSGDLLVGVYDPTVANTLVLDLGVNYGSLYDGEQFNLFSSLAAAGFSSTLSAGTQFGVVGAITSGNLSAPHIVYETTDGFTPGTIDDPTIYSGLKSDIVTLYNNPVASANSGPDFKSAITIGAGYLADGLGYSVAGPGTDTLGLWQVVDDGSNPTLLGTFTMNNATETLTYVPEPTTLSLIGGAGLLALAFRNKFRRA